MTTTTTHVAEMSDAAALLVAEVAGDEEATRLVIEALIEGRDFRGAVLLLRHTLTLAATAVRYEAERAHAEGEDSTPSVSYLVAASRHASRTGEGV